MGYKVAGYEGENVYRAQRAIILICDATAFPFFLQVMRDIEDFKISVGLTYESSLKV